jgi:hypothetical protein
MAGEHFDSSWMRIQNEHNTSSWIPFAVITAGKCVGLTCYIGPEAANRCIDIAVAHDGLCDGFRTPARSLSVQHARRPVGRRSKVASERNRGG